MASPERGLLLAEPLLSTIDTYSFGAAGSPWLAHEWLSELVYFTAFKALGLPGVFLVYFALLVLIFAGVYYRCSTAGADCKDGTIMTLLAILLATVSIGPRVLLFGWLCMVALLLVLDRFEHTGKGIWFLPAIFAIWINFHASWVFGLIVLGLFTAGGFVEGEWGAITARRWTRKELTSLLLASAASLGALFVNPFGSRLVLYPFNFLFRQQSNMQYIEEWQSVDLSSANGKLVYIVIFGLLAAFWFTNRRWKLGDMLLLAFALWTGLTHVRFLFFLGLIVVPILAPSLNLFTPYDRKIDKPWLNAAIVACIITAFVFFFRRLRSCRSRSMGPFHRRSALHAGEAASRPDLQSVSSGAATWSGQHRS